MINTSRRSAVSPSERGSSAVIAALGFPPPQSLRRSINSGRAVQSIRRGTSYPFGELIHEFQESVVSPNRRSSNTSTIGVPVASSSIRRRHALGASD